MRCASWYKQLIDGNPNSLYRKFAEQQVTLLDQPRNTGFQEWFKTAPLPSVNLIEKNPFDKSGSPLLPDLSIPSPSSSSTSNPNEPFLKLSNPLGEITGGSPTESPTTGAGEKGAIAAPEKSLPEAAGDAAKPAAETPPAKAAGK